jgi:protein subunit release factor B
MRIPRDRLEVRFARSGGPGGQNVNKVSSKAEVRFRIDDADWIPASVRRRLKELQAHRTTNDGDLIISSSRHRTQSRNLEDCIEKLRRYLEEAAKVRKRRLETAPTRAARAKRLDRKKRRGRIKRARGWRPGEE